jgi:putative tricarboxylic transport membrane protein
MIASMIVGNAVLLALSVPAIRLWISVLRLPTSILNAVIVVLAVIGIFSVNNEPSDIAILAVMTLVGAGLKAANYPLAPAVLAFILCPPIEATLRQSLDHRFHESDHLSRIPRDSVGA